METTAQANRSDQDRSAQASALELLVATAEKSWQDDPFADLRRRALDVSGFPSLPPVDTESWRKIDLGPLDLAGFDLSGRTEPDIETFGPSAPASATVAIGTLSEAEQAALRQALEQRLQNDRGHVFERLAVGLAGSPHAHTLPPSKTSAAAPETAILTLRHGAMTGNSLLSHNLVLVRAGQELTVVEEFDGPVKATQTLWSTATDVVVMPGGSVKYIALRNFSGGEFHFHDSRFSLKRDARAHASIVHRGGAVGKAFITGSLQEPGAEFRGIGIMAGRQREFLDIEMTAEHLAEHTDSSLLYKTVLEDRAHSIFNGNLFIAPGLKHTRSHQINNNILLSRRARAESMPNLVVRAEDVSAEHGATVGELDKDSLFFLMSRGIPEQEARQLLIAGFIEGIVREIPLASRHDEILRGIRDKLSI